MFPQTPINQYLLLLITTYAASIPAFFAAINAPEELKQISPVLEHIKKGLLLAIFILFTLSISFSPLAIALTLSAFIFYLKFKNKERTMLPLLAITLFSSLPKPTLLKLESILIFLYILFTTTTYIATFEKNKKIKTPTKELILNILKKNAGYLFVGLLFFLIQL